MIVNDVHHDDKSMLLAAQRYLAALDTEDGSPCARVV